MGPWTSSPTSCCTRPSRGSTWVSATETFPGGSSSSGGRMLSSWEKWTQRKLTLTNLASLKLVLRKFLKNKPFNNKKKRRLIEFEPKPLKNGVLLSQQKLH